MESSIDFKDVICDVLAGSFAGVAFVLSAQPFDTIKVRMQMMTENQSIFRTTYRILTKEGVRALPMPQPFAFYKGVVPPLMFSFPVSSTLFAAYEQYMRYFRVERDSLQYRHWILGGCYAGFIQSFVTGPSELFKIVFQMQLEYMPKRYTSLYSCVSDFIRREGIKAFFKGTVPTIFRDIPQYAFYFLTFEYVKYEMLKSEERDELNVWEQLIAGCLAGFACITFSYPQDVIKTKIQGEATLAPHERLYKATYFDGGIAKCARHVYNEQGIKGFITGFNSCAIYYIVACAAQLAGYEQARIFLNRYVKNVE